MSFFYTTIKHQIVKFCNNTSYEKKSIFNISSVNFTQTLAQTNPNFETSNLNTHVTWIMKFHM